MEGQGQNLTTHVNIPCKQKLVVYGVQIKRVDALSDYNWYEFVTSNQAQSSF
jgi:hypothetical protein